MIGTTVSHYRIIEKLGEGGMGVVYKAQDTKLDRLVALKFLPPNVSASEPEKARFIQEAKSAAGLNHPNICTIYGIEEHQGQLFIDMEYVDGATLRGHLHSGGLKLETAISYAIQIAEALQEAHGKGIVHRDVKADNVMINSKNQVKVMDFGLAKLKGSLKLTRSSSTVGTLAYMAPEQIQGGEADARSDIFSFGALLFEMLTGRLPFRGEHEAAMVYSIVNEDPEPIQKYRPEISPELIHILGRALEKNPEDRYQSMNEMTIDLRRLKKESTKLSRTYPIAANLQESKSPQGEFAEVASNQKTSLSSRTVYLIGGPLLLLAVVVTVWLFMRPSSGTYENLVFKPLQVPFTTIWYPGLSADGNWIAFPATDLNNNTEIYYMNAAGGEPRRLTNDSVWKYTADISPDGSQILYTRGTSRRPFAFPVYTYAVSTLGGASRKLGDRNSNAPRWSPDGTKIAYLGPGVETGTRIGLWTMDADGSDKRRVLSDTLADRVSFAWSPDAKSFAWLRTFLGTTGFYEEIIIHDLESGKQRQITFDQKNIDEVYWMPQGEILFSSNREGPSNLWAIPSSGGTPVQITRGPGPDLGIKASHDGRRVLYLQQAFFGAVCVADLNGLNVQQLTPDDQSVQDPSFSPDGQQIAFLVPDPDPIKTISHFYVVDIKNQSRRQITTKGENIENFVWSPDGRKLAYSLHVTVEVDTAHDVGILDLSDPSQKNIVGKGRVIEWLKDGLSLNVTRHQTSWRVPLDGGIAERLFEDSTVVMHSPDGKALAVVDARVGRIALWLKTPEKSLKMLVEGAVAPIQWFPDGRSIVYTKNDEKWSVAIGTGKSQRYAWKNPDAIAFNQISPDQKRTVFVKQRMNAKLILIDNFH